MVTQPDMPVGPEAEDPLNRPGINEQEPPGQDPRARLNGDTPAPSAPGWPAGDPGARRNGEESVWNAPRWPAEDEAAPGTDARLNGSAPAAGALGWPAEDEAAAPRPYPACPSPSGRPAPPRPATDSERAAYPQPRIRLGLAVAAAALGVVGLVVSLIGVAVQVLPRKFSAAQQHQIMAWQVASRWRIWPAGKIFPASVGYTDSAAFFGSGPAGLPLDAHRAGIAPPSSCADSIDGALARVLQRHGCTAVLRATYTDATGTFMITLGVVVSRGTAPAPRALPGGRGIRPGVKPVAFAGTLAARFGVRQRQLASAIAYGPYLILYTAGYTDGRRRDQVSANPYIAGEMTSAAQGIAAAVGTRLGAPPRPPTCPGAPGC